ncbi:transporter substrate-binding domain-containing protein [Duganella ginsengisoli]|uniref:Transporter substrate-binding domain-containing protein n=2 Tax=Pseudoduganella ginsengisoli TaxID=1462440 RepID=A0A6L6Q2X7_9BURK|nr:transporter substrate-binding domain-containing protein [Pseudoduganella ginsengisoli]
MLLAPVLLAAAPVSARELLAIGAHFERVFERGQEGDIVGLGPEIIKVLAQRMGHTVRFELYPWARAQALITQGKADILVGPYKNPERLQNMAFSKLAFYQDQMVFYARADANASWNGDFGTLGEQRIVVLNGWAYGTAFDQARPQLRLSVANSVDSGLKMLVHQHVNLFASNRRNTEPVMGRLGLVGQVVMLPKVIDVQEGYFAFPRDTQFDTLRRDFDAAFQRMVDSGELKKLGQRYEVNVP